MANGLNKQAELRNLLKKIGKNPDPFYLAEVVSVDVANKTAVCKDLQREVSQVVSLQPTANDNGMLVYPKVGSWVVVGQTDDNGNGFVLMCEEFDAFELRLNDVQMVLNDEGISFNGGKLGGLAKVKELVDELKKVNDFIEAFKNVLAGAPVAEAGNGAPSALQIALNTALGAMQLPTYQSIENEKVKH